MTILLTLGLIILLTKIADSLAIKFGLPSVVGSLTIGILVGPSVFNLIQNDLSIDMLAQLGVILLMFLAGVESDLRILKKYFKPSLITGLLGVFVPFITFFLTTQLLQYSKETSLFIGLIFGATSLSITLQVLKELNFINSKESHVIIGAAILDDIIAIILLNLILNGLNPNTSAKDIFPFILKNILFFIAIYFIGRFVMPLLLKGVAYLKVPEKEVAFALILVFFLSSLAETLGMSDIIGAFFAGILISQTDFAPRVERKVTSITLSMFAPVFFVSIGLNLVLDGLKHNIGLIVLFCFLAVATKFVGGFLGGKVNQFNNGSSAIIGASMASRGEMALILISLALSKEFINQELYAVLVLVVIFTAIIAPVVLKATISRHATLPNNSTSPYNQDKIKNN
ncbi:cation:proton antiporter [Vagococcus sp.]|uniref:cation:proton antiporter n=1 Tax=Vagococcus sp. TaxID=1933889 RepID=UPI003F98A1FD